MASMTFFGGINEIGGNKILLDDGNGCRVFMDFGRRLKRYNDFYGGFTKERSNSGARDLLKLGILPKIDGIYRKCLLDVHVDNVDPAVTQGKDIEWDAFQKAPDYWRAPDVTSYETWKDQHDGKAFLDAVLLSHAHYDHVQDITYLSAHVPIYCSRETKLLVKAISDVSKSSADLAFYYYSTPEMAFDDTNPAEVTKTYFSCTPYLEKENIVLDKEIPQINKTFTIDTTTPEERQYIAKQSCAPFSIGDFTVTLFETDHSLPGACAFLVEIGGKRILYTGDLRFHGRSTFNMDDFCAAVGNPLDILVIEGTRVKSELQLTEIDVEANIAREISDVQGLVLVDFNWKDVDRFTTIHNAARQSGRTLLILPKLAYLLHQLYLLDGTKYQNPVDMDDVKVYLHRHKDMLYSKDEYKEFDAGYLEEWGRNRAKSDVNLKRIKERIINNAQEPGDDEAWALATHHLTHGIRAYQVRENPEQYVLMLSYLTVNELLDLTDPLGRLSNSKYIRASCEPFNDEMLVDEAKMIAWLKKFDISYDAETVDGQEILKRNHVSGHASRPELEELIKHLKPAVLYPVHTEHPELFKDMVPEGTTVVDSIIEGNAYPI